MRTLTVVFVLGSAVICYAAATGATWLVGVALVVSLLVTVVSLAATTEPENDGHDHDSDCFE